MRHITLLALLATPAAAQTEGTVQTEGAAQVAIDVAAGGVLGVLPVTDGSLYPSPLPSLAVSATAAPASLRGHLRARLGAEVALSVLGVDPGGVAEARLEAVPSGAPDGVFPGVGVAAVEVGGCDGSSFECEFNRFDHRAERIAELLG